VTESSVKSENCHQELNFALSRERKILAVHLAPVQLTAGIELSLSNKQAIVKPDLGADAFAAKLLGAVKDLMPKTRVVEIPGFEPTKVTDERQSVAILPLVNRSSDPENEYLCDGIAEELITGLARLDDLRVASQLQSFAYKGQVQDIGEIGQKLRVANVLTGSIQKSGERVRVTTTLTETDTGDVIWSERYDGTIEDVFDLQEEVASKVVKALELKLTAGDDGNAKSLINAGTTNPVAYQHFMLGRYEFCQFTRQGLLKAHDHFERAIAADPEFGRACYLDFITWCIQRNSNFVTQEEMYPHAKAALDRYRQTSWDRGSPAVMDDRFLDPSLIPSVREEAEEAIAAIKDASDDWHGFQYTRLAFMLASAGLLNGACEYWEYFFANYPQEVDDSPTNTNYGSALFALGRFEKAIDHYSAVYARYPEQILILGTRAMVYSRTGQYQKAAADLEELAQTFPRNFAQFYDLYWRRELDAANAYFEWLEAQKNLIPLFKAWGCFLLGHFDRGFSHGGGFNAFGLRVVLLYPLTSSQKKQVMSHPRYQELLNQQGSDNSWRDELCDMANSVQHITGIHVSLDDEY